MLPSGQNKMNAYVIVVMKVRKFWSSFSFDFEGFRKGPSVEYLPYPRKGTADYNRINY